MKIFEPILTGFLPVIFSGLILNRFGYYSGKLSSEKKIDIKNAILAYQTGHIGEIFLAYFNRFSAGDLLGLIFNRFHAGPLPARKRVFLRFLEFQPVLCRCRTRFLRAGAGNNPGNFTMACRCFLEP